MRVGNLKVDMRQRYIVTTGPHHVIYSGYDPEVAERIANFWDERQDTWLDIEGPPSGALTRAMWRFDRLRELIANA